jgi:hypothetical protein
MLRPEQAVADLDAYRAHPRVGSGEWAEGSTLLVVLARLDLSGERHTNIIRKPLFGSQDRTILVS